MEKLVSVSVINVINPAVVGIEHAVNAIFENLIFGSH